MFMFMFAKIYAICCMHKYIHIYTHIQTYSTELLIKTLFKNVSGHNQVCNITRLKQIMTEIVVELGNRQFKPSLNYRT